MGSIDIAGQSLTLTPMTLGRLRHAAKFIEKANAAPEGSGMKVLARMADVLRVIVIAAGAPRMAPEEVESAVSDLLSRIDLSDAAKIWSAYLELLLKSGLTEPSDQAQPSGLHAALARRKAAQDHDRPPLEQQVEEIIFDLVAAGVEGGSLRAIEDGWTMQDVKAIQAAWARNGPPVYITAAAFAGFKGSKEADDQKDFDELLGELVQNRQLK